MMNKNNHLLLKLDAILAFVDLKVFLLVWILTDVYRNTSLLASTAGINRERAADVLAYVWSTCGSPYIVWIPLAAIADVLTKNAIKSFLE